MSIRAEDGQNVDTFKDFSFLAKKAWTNHCLFTRFLQMSNIHIFGKSGYFYIDTLKDAATLDVAKDDVV